MANIREYLQKKEKREAQKKQDFDKKILKHRLSLLLRILLIGAVIAGIGLAAYIQMKNQTYSGFEILSSIERKVYNGSAVLAYENGFLTYSKDGISYTDAKGNAVWNQTYEMQSPLVRVKGKWVAVGDYNGHIIYDIGSDGTVQEIDTNLPIRSLAVAANGVVAAVLEDSSVTWINVYNPNGDNAVKIKTTMQKSGYPMSISLSDSGKLLQVAYLRAESGTMKSIVSFYNFDEVGQNYTDTMVSSYELSESVTPLAAFMSAGTAFSVADDQLVVYEGTEIPKNICQRWLSEEIQNVYYSANYIALVFLGTDGSGKYRVDVFDTSGELILSKPFDIEYREIIFNGSDMIIYNEAECIITAMNGRERYEGELTQQTLLLKPMGGRRYLAVTQDYLTLIEMK